MGDSPYNTKVRLEDGHLSSQKYTWDGQHVYLTFTDKETGEFVAENRVNFRATRRHLNARGKYMPHQGKAECARRRAAV